MMVSELSDVEDLNPFDLIDAEAERIDRFYSALATEEWGEPTRCAEWNRRDLLAHLATVEDYTQAGLDDTLETLMAEVRRQGGGDLNEWGFRRRAGWPPARVLEQWRELSANSRRRLRERGPDALMATSVGPYPVGQQTFYLACEAAIHADDAGVPVRDGERAGRLAWRARFGRVALAEYERPVQVEPGAGVYLLRLGELEATLSDEDFVEATSGRLPEDHPLPAKLRQELAVLN